MGDEFSIFLERDSSPTLNIQLYNHLHQKQTQKINSRPH